MRWFPFTRRVRRGFRPRVVELERRVVPSFLVPLVYEAGPNASSLAVGDVNGDGLHDLAVANDLRPSGTVRVLLGNGDGSFQAPAPSSSGAVPDLWSWKISTRTDCPTWP